MTTIGLVFKDESAKPQVEKPKVEKAPEEDSVKKVTPPKPKNEKK